MDTPLRSERPLAQLSPLSLRRRGVYDGSEVRFDEFECAYDPRDESGEREGRVERGERGERGDMRGERGERDEY